MSEGDEPLLTDQVAAPHTLGRPYDLLDRIVSGSTRFCSSGEIELGTVSGSGVSPIAGALGRRMSILMPRLLHYLHRETCSVALLAGYPFAGARRSHRLEYRAREPIFVTTRASHILRRKCARPLRASIPLAEAAAGAAVDAVDVDGVSVGEGIENAPDVT